MTIYVSYSCKYHFQVCNFTKVRINNIWMTSSIHRSEKTNIVYIFDDYTALLQIDFATTHPFSLSAEILMEFTKLAPYLKCLLCSNNQLVWNWTRWQQRLGLTRQHKSWFGSDTVVYFKPENNHANLANIHNKFQMLVPLMPMGKGGSNHTIMSIRLLF